MKKVLKLITTSLLLAMIIASSAICFADDGKPETLKVSIDFEAVSSIQIIE